MDFFSSLRPHYPEEVVLGLQKALSEKRVYGLYLNTEKMSDEELLSRFPFLTPHPIVPHAYLYDGEVYPLGKSLEHNLRVFYCMDPASMVVPYFLAPKKGERLLDYCAAPGGKTVVASLLMENEGAILSNDLSYSRSLETSHNVERMGRGNVAVVSGDLSSLPPHVYEGYFDRVLLDAPCSGSAMFRKEPKMMKDWTEEKVLRQAKIQAELLEVASKYVRKGGTIAYSTCSFSYEEDEAIVLSFLEKHPNFKAIPIADNPLFYSHPALPEAIHVFPHLHPGEGQFLALLKECGEEEERKEGRYGILPPKLAAVLAPYGLGNRDYLRHKDAYYALSMPLRIPDKISLLRYGIKLCEDKEPFIPDHALSSFAPKAMRIELSEDLAKKYLRGETFPLKEKDGYAVVSYQGLPLGFVKVSKGIAKNHYPKGLRRDYR